jgi:hypothetical protein
MFYQNQRKTFTKLRGQRRFAPPHESGNSERQASHTEQHDRRRFRNNLIVRDGSIQQRVRKNRDLVGIGQIIHEVLDIVTREVVAVRRGKPEPRQ